MAENSDNNELLNKKNAQNQNNDDAFIINEGNLNHFEELKSEEKDIRPVQATGDSNNIIDSDLDEVFGNKENQNIIEEEKNEIIASENSLSNTDNGINEENIIEKIISKPGKAESIDIPKEDPLNSSNIIDNSDIIDSLDLPDTVELISNNNIKDININTINDILSILHKNKYDFVTFEPSDTEVKLEFRKNGVIVETKYVKYPVYSTILLKAKSIGKLSLDVTDQEQESTIEESFSNKTFRITTKVVGSNFGEKLFIKAVELEKKLSKKPVQKISAGQILSFLGIVSAIILIVGGSFLAFIVLSAQTVEDVKFFQGLGISLNDINNFISKVVTIVFTALMIIETIVLVILLFKFFLTKKEFKRKKIQFGILSAILLISTLSTLGAWMIIDKKIRELPNWQEMSYGEIQLYDNDKLTNETFDKQGALITDTTRIIGPIKIMFDLTYLAQNQARRGITIESYIWNFGGVNIESTLPTLIHTFNTVGTIKPTLTLKGKDILGRDTSEIIENIPPLNITHIVSIDERQLNTGGKQVTFDATNIKELGPIEWFNIKDTKNALLTGYRYISQPLFEDTIFLMKIKNIDGDIHKLFIIRGENETELSGTIDYTRGLSNDLEVTFKVTNINNIIGTGFVEKFVWKIGSQEFSRIGDINSQEKSSEMKFTFSDYGLKEVSVELINTAGEKIILNKDINLTKTLKITDGIKMVADDEKINNVTYNSAINEYMINDLGIPNTLIFDGRNVKVDSALYTLKNIAWDFNSDGDIDFEGKTGQYDINAEGNYTITAYIRFENRRNNKEIEEIVQKIYIQATRKEAIVDFEIKASSEYVPIVVGFDGSKSQIKDSNIVRFTWDYGDGIIEDRDAVVPGHLYTIAGDYHIKLTVTTQNGKSYSNTKSLILKPSPQSVKIKSSVKKAPVGQGIDFISSDSEGQIANFLWDFGDGNISTQANPTHSYKTPGKYTIKLKLEFINRNILDNSIEIEIY